MSIYLATEQRRSMQKLWSCLDQHLTPFLKGGFVLAISGGPDSRSLLESVALWPLRKKTRILVVSLDHGIRTQSAKESFFVLARAKRLGFEVFTKKLSSNKILGEHELRSWRYGVLFEIMEQENLHNLVLAHHANDNAEGFLMSLFGVGGKSFGASMEHITLYGESKNIIRPFLSLSKNELLWPLTMHNQTDFAIDNLDEAQYGQRAWIRNSVLPQLSCFSSNIAERLNYFAKNQAIRQNVAQNLARNAITWKKEEKIAYIDLKNSTDVVRIALKDVLKKLSSNKDLRSSSKTLENILSIASGIDQFVNSSKVSGLKDKTFKFSGIAVKFDNDRLVVRPSF